MKTNLFFFFLVLCLGMVIGGAFNRWMERPVADLSDTIYEREEDWRHG